MSKKSLVWVSAVVLIGLIACSGCTGTTPSAGAKEQPKMTGSGLLIITEESWPNNYRDDTGAIVGRSTEVVRTILARLNRTADIELMPWNEGYERALSTPNVALYSTARTAQRETLFSWVGPIAPYEMVFYERNGSTLMIDSLEAVRRVKAVAVVRNDVRHQYLVDNNVTNLLLLPTDEECVRSLIRGEADLWLGSKDTATRTALSVGVDPMAIVEVYPVRTIELFIAFNKQTPASVVTEWQETLDAMKRDGTYAAIVGAPSVSSPPAEELVPVESALSALTALADQKILTVARSLEALALTDDAALGEWERIRPLLAGIEKNPEPSIRAWYALPDGSYYTPVDGLTGSSLKDRAYFPGVLAGNISIGTVVVSHSTGRDTAIAAVPIVNESKVTGVLGASIYLDSLSETLKRDMMLPDGMFFLALNPDGQIALHSRGERIAQDMERQGTSSMSRAVQTICSSEKGTVEYEYEGRLWRVIFETSPVTGWRFGIGWVPEM